MECIWNWAVLFFSLTLGCISNKESIPESSTANVFYYLRVQLGLRALSQESLNLSCEFMQIDLCSYGSHVNVVTICCTCTPAKHCSLILPDSKPWRKECYNETVSLICVMPRDLQMYSWSGFHGIFRSGWSFVLQFVFLLSVMSYGFLFKNSFTFHKPHPEIFLFKNK